MRCNERRVPFDHVYSLFSVRPHSSFVRCNLAVKKFERATDGNLWAGAQHWKKKPSTLGKKDKKADGEKRRVMFDDEGNEEKKERKRGAKKERAFIDFGVAPE